MARPQGHPSPSPAAAIADFASELLAALESDLARRRNRRRSEAMEGVEAGRIVDVPDTPDRMAPLKMNEPLVGNQGGETLNGSSVCPMVLEVPDTPDRLTSQQSSGSTIDVENERVISRFRGGRYLYPCSGRNQRFQLNLPQSDVAIAEENVFASDRLKSDATQYGALKFANLNRRKDGTTNSLSTNQFRNSSSSDVAPVSAEMCSSDCKIQNRNIKKVIDGNEMAPHVFIEPTSSKFQVGKMFTDSASSSGGEDSVVDVFGFKGQFEAAKMLANASHLDKSKEQLGGENQTGSFLDGPQTAGGHFRHEVDVAAEGDRISHIRGPYGSHDEYSAHKNSVELARSSRTRNNGKGADLCGYSQVKKMQNRLASVESPSRNGQKRLVRNGCISPINIAKVVRPLETKGKNVLNANGGTISSLQSSQAGRVKSKGVVSDTQKAGGARGRHLPRREPLVLEVDDIFKMAEEMGGFRTSGSFPRNTPAASLDDVYCTTSSMFDGNRRKMKDSDTSAELIQNTVLESRKSFPSKHDGHCHASSSMIFGVDSETKGQNGVVQQTKRQCRSSSNSNREYSMSSLNEMAVTSARSSSNEGSSRPSSSGGSSTFAPIIDIDESNLPKAGRCNSSKDTHHIDDNSGERTRQIEKDEEFARQLQEQLYNDVPELDASIALTLQHEEDAQTISTRHMANPIDTSMAHLYRYGPRAVRNSSARVANRGQGTASTRMAQLRRNAGSFPRRASSSRRPIEFPSSMDLDMRLHLLEAMEAAGSSLSMTSHLHQVQRDFNENDYEMLLALDEENHQRGGASLQQINALPQSTVQTDSFEEACAVCLENPSSGDTIRHLPCLHKFHKDCIDPWLRRKPSCPVCKSGIT